MNSRRVIESIMDWRENSVGNVKVISFQKSKEEHNAKNGTEYRANKEPRTWKIVKTRKLIKSKKLLLVWGKLNKPMFLKSLANIAGFKKKLQKSIMRS